MHLSVHMITTEDQRASHIFSPLAATACQRIHIPLLFSEPLPLLSGSVWNPFIVTAVWHWQCTRGPARSRLRGKKHFFFYLSFPYLWYFFLCFFRGGWLLCLHPVYFKWRATQLQHMGGDLWESVKTDKTQSMADATLDAFLTPAGCLLLLRISVVYQTDATPWTFGMPGT